MARKADVSATAIGEGPAISGITLEYGDGHIVSYLFNDIPETLYAQLMFHGLKQKLVDAAAISRDPETGRSPSIDAKRAAISAVWANLEAGEWSTRGTGSGGSAGSLLFRALVRLYPDKDADTIREFLDGKDKKEQAAMRRNPRVASVIEEIKAEAGGSGDDDLGAELLGELDD